MTFTSSYDRSCAPSARKTLSLTSLVSLARQRRQLAALDASALKDIGVTREAASTESRRPAWDVPGHWRG